MIPRALKKLFGNETDRHDKQDPFERLQSYANSLRKKLKPLFDVEKEWKIICDPDLSSEVRKARIDEIQNRRKEVFRKELNELEKMRPEEIEKDEFRRIIENRVWRFLQRRLAFEMEQRRSCPIDPKKIKDPQSLGEWLAMLMAQQIIDQCRQLIDRYHSDIQKFLQRIQVNFPFDPLETEIHDLMENLSRLFRHHVAFYQLRDGSEQGKDAILVALNAKKSDLKQVIEELHHLFITIDKANSDQLPELYKIWKEWLIRFDRLENNLQELINNKIRYHQVLEEEQGIRLINEQIDFGIKECQLKTQQYETEANYFIDESHRLAEENKRLKFLLEKKEKIVTKDSQVNYINFKLF